MTDDQFDALKAGVKGWSIATLVVSGILCFLIAVAIVGNAITDGSLEDLGLLFLLPVYLAFIGFTVAVVSSIPAAGLVWIVRIARLPRPLSDILGGAVVPLLWTKPFFSQVAPIFQLNPLEIALAILGAVGGAIYWKAAGKPQPPYTVA